MGFDIKEAIGFFSMRINIGQFFDRSSEDVFVTMNEPDEDDQFKLSENPIEMKKLWKKYIDADKHNFEFVDPADNVVKPASKEQVIQILTRKGICLTYIIGQWFKTLPLPSKTVSK